MTLKDIRTIQASGTSHQTIDAIISYLECKEAPTKTEFSNVKKPTKKK